MTDKTKITPRPRRALRFNGRPVFAFDASSPRRSAAPEEDAQITVGGAR